ncbi:MAG: VWA domain-containing protein [Myxococcales bacterium]|nr:VWA domain-containing protein [Myxococcales bacterium]
MRRSPWLLSLALLATACSIEETGTAEPYRQAGARLAPPPAPAALCEGGGQRDPDPNAPARPGQDGDEWAGGGGGGGAGGGYYGGPDAGTAWYPDAEVDQSLPPPDLEPDVAPPPDLGVDDGGACVPGEDPDDGVPCESEADGGVGSETETDRSPLCEEIDLENPRVLYLSADDSNSMASPVLIRHRIDQGQVRFGAAQVRTYEFLNYARFDFERPPPGELAVIGQLGGCAEGELALQIAVVSPALPALRAPMHVVLVLDTSGSMGGAPIERLKDTVRAIARGLRAGDKVSAVQWAIDQTPLLEGVVVDGPDDARLLALADGLRTGGGTDLSGGLRAGYAQAERHGEPGLLTRVVLVSDGGANAGVTDEALIGEKAQDEDGEGVYLVGVGVGDASGYNDALMDVVTDAGRGAYVFVDSAAEAQHVFTERFDETMLVAARDVKVQLTLPPYFNIKKFFGEEYSPDPAKVRPQHLAPSDAMVFQQIVRACDPALVRAEHPVSVKVTWQDPETGAPRALGWTRTLGELTHHHPNLHKASAIVAFAEALKQSQDLDDGALIELYEGVRAEVDAVDPGRVDADLNGLRAQLERMLQTLGGRAPRDPEPEPWDEPRDAGLPPPDAAAAPPADPCAVACETLADCAVEPDHCPAVATPQARDALHADCQVACASQPAMAVVINSLGGDCGRVIEVMRSASANFAAACEGR